MDGNGHAAPLGGPQRIVIDEIVTLPLVAWNVETDNAGHVVLVFTKQGGTQYRIPMSEDVAAKMGSQLRAPRIKPVTGIAGHG